ncbi:MAG: hypothetical protein MHM6MM_004931 [Cercozoa sp. M6MM]
MTAQRAARLGVLIGRICRRRVRVNQRLTSAMSAQMSPESQEHHEIAARSDDENDANQANADGESFDSFGNVSEFMKVLTATRQALRAGRVPQVGDLCLLATSALQTRGANALEWNKIVDAIEGICDDFVLKENAYLRTAIALLRVRALMDRCIASDVFTPAASAMDSAIGHDRQRFLEERWWPHFAESKLRQRTLRRHGSLSTMYAFDDATSAEKTEFSKMTSLTTIDDAIVDSDIDVPPLVVALDAALKKAVRYAGKMPEEQRHMLPLDYLVPDVWSVPPHEQRRPGGMLQPEQSNDLASIENNSAAVVPLSDKRRLGNRVLKLALLCSNDTVLIALADWMTVPDGRVTVSEWGDHLARVASAMSRACVALELEGSPVALHVANRLIDRVPLSRDGDGDSDDQQLRQAVAEVVAHMDAINAMTPVLHERLRERRSDSAVPDRDGADSDTDDDDDDDDDDNLFERDSSVLTQTASSRVGDLTDTVLTVTDTDTNTDTDTDSGTDGVTDADTDEFTKEVACAGADDHDTVTADDTSAEIITDVTADDTVSADEEENVDAFESSDNVSAVEIRDLCCTALTADSIARLASPPVLQRFSEVQTQIHEEGLYDRAPVVNMLLSHLVPHMLQYENKRELLPLLPLLRVMFSCELPTLPLNTPRKKLSKSQLADLRSRQMLLSSLPRVLDADELEHLTVMLDIVRSHPVYAEALRWLLPRVSKDERRQHIKHLELSWRDAILRNELGAQTAMKELRRLMPPTKVTTPAKSEPIMSRPARRSAKPNPFDSVPVDTKLQLLAKVRAVLGAPDSDDRDRRKPVRTETDNTHQRTRQRHVTLAGYKQGAESLRQGNIQRFVELDVSRVPADWLKFPLKSLSRPPPWMIQTLDADGAQALLSWLRQLVQLRETDITSDATNVRRVVLALQKIGVRLSHAAADDVVSVVKSDWRFARCLGSVSHVLTAEQLEDCLSFVVTEASTSPSFDNVPSLCGVLCLDAVPPRLRRKLLESYEHVLLANKGRDTECQLLLQQLQLLRTSQLEPQ